MWAVIQWNKRMEWICVFGLEWFYSIEPNKGVLCCCI